MKLTRRGFFAGIAGLVVAPQFVPAPLLAPAQPVSGASIAHRFFDGGWQDVGDDVIHHAARLLGIIAPGEALSRVESQEFRFHLCGMASEGQRFLSKSHLSMALAARVAPVFSRATHA